MKVPALLHYKLRGRRLRQWSLHLASILAITGLVFAYPMQALAADTGLVQQAKISFTFDDGLLSSLNKAAPALQAYGYTGTTYAITNCVGSKGTCPADPDASYMTWAQLTKIRDTYGWEVGSHSVTHPLMTEISASQLETEVATSKQALVAHGFNPTAFATPYGDYNNAVKAAIAKYYSSHRPFADQQWGNDWPYNPYLLYVKQVQVGVSVAQVKQYIDQAKQNKQWLVLVFHGIADTPSSNPDDYQYSTSNLKQIAAYAKAQGLPGVNVSNGLVQRGINQLPNSTFDNGVTGGWTTDQPLYVTKDTNAHGNYPSPQNSIKFSSNPTNPTRLFSPKIDVTNAKTYIWKTYLNLQSLTSGEVTFYIDEYDANGNWISGQYKFGEKSADVENVNLTYKPSSVNVKQASLQLSVGANSGIVGYIDTMQFFPTE